MYRLRVAILLLSSSILVCIGLVARQTIQQVVSPPSAPTLLQNALVALDGNLTVSDVTLSGTARSIAGSADETGTGLLKAISSGASRIDLSLPSGQRYEIVNSTLLPPVGSWAGPDAVSHPLSLHNLLTDPSWFFPALTVSHLVSSQNTIASYIGQETLNGQSVLHVSVYQPTAGTTGKTAAFFARLSRMELYLDPGTNRPVALLFNTHPDDDAGLNIPTQILYSDYRSVNGVQVPFHVQKFLNNVLVFDFQVQNVTVNSGLSVSAFTIQ